MPRLQKVCQSSIAPSGKLVRSDEMLVPIRRIRFSVVTDGGGSICFGFINLKERMAALSTEAIVELI